MTLALIILFSLLGSIASLGLAASVLLLKKEKLRKFTLYAINYATGTLLGAAFLGLIPHALHELSSQKCLATVLGGIFLFFLLEKLVIWRHCHKEHCEIHSQTGVLILVGDSLHNFVDGVAIAAAFMGSVQLGIATSIAIIVHEIPQEVGDFAILIESGFSRKKALFYNALSSATALVGAIGAYFLLNLVQGLVPYLMAVSAASFIYIALADLIPSQRRSVALSSVLSEFGLLALGIGTIAILHLSQH